ncbi:hypothetical protein ACFQX6_28925 [Streptosporangium lutulentum]
MRVVMMAIPSDPKVIEACERAGVGTVLSTLPSTGLSRVELQMDAFETALAEMRGE